MSFIRKGSLVKLTELGKQRIFSTYPNFAFNLFKVGEIFLILEPPSKVVDPEGLWTMEYHTTVLWGETVFKLISIARSGECFEDYLQVVEQ